MKFSDLPLNPTRKALRQFAGAWLVFFLACGLYQWFVKGHAHVGMAFCILAVVIGPLGLIKPGAVRWIFVTWMLLAFPIGWVVSQAILLVLFYLLITPVALFFRIRGRDLLCRKRPPGRESFWIPKTTPADVRSYFRQY